MFYKYDPITGKYLSKIKHAKYRLDGKLIEGFTKEDPPKCPEDSELYYINGEWVIKPKPEDYRGKWVNSNGKVIMINKVGEVPPDGYAKEVSGTYYYPDGTLADEIKQYFDKKKIMFEIEKKKNQLIDEETKLIDSLVKKLFSGEDLSKLISEYQEFLVKKNKILKGEDKL